MKHASARGNTESEAMNIDPRLLDVDFGSAASVVRRGLGCTPRSDRPGDRFSVFERSFDLLPRSRWAELIDEHVSMEILPQETKDQKNEGSCTSNASSQDFECVRVAELGAENWIKTSPISLYKRCAPGPNSGSSLSDNLHELVTRGILPSDTPENRNRAKRLGLEIEHFHPDTGYYTPLPTGWEDTAALFRADEVFDIQSFDGLMSALLYHWPVVYARSGHCILAVRPVRDRNKFYLKYLNSWGQWGENGYGYDSESAVSWAISLYGCFVVRSTIVPVELRHLALAA